MKCPRCKRPKIDPNGAQADKIIQKFMVRYLYDRGDGVLEQDLMDATHQMAIHHELCFMEGDECPLLPSDNEIDALLDLMIQNGHITKVGDGFAITKEGIKYYESLPKKVRDEYKKRLDKS